MARKIGYKDFLDALYQNVFGKSTDVPDKTMYLDGLILHDMGPEDVLKSVLTCEQVEAKNLNHEKFLKLAYKAFGVTKVPDETFAFWLGKMEIRSKVGVINGLCLSEEWAEFRKKYGV